MPAKVAKHFTLGAQFKRFQQNPKEKAPKMLAFLAPKSPPERHFSRSLCKILLLRAGLAPSLQRKLLLLQDLSPLNAFCAAPNQIEQMPHK
jgi:hypothetical protein